MKQKFKQTELGELLEDWEVVRLGDVTEFSRKPRSLNISKHKKIPFIPMECIPDEKSYISKYELKNQDGIKSGTFFFKGDLLVAKITPSFENGKQCIIDDLPTDFGYATTEVWPLHGTDRCDILYLFYYLKKHEIRTEIAAKMEGSTGRQRVPKNVLAKLEIPLPPLPEQHRIAAVLSAVQDAKETTGAVIATAKSLKKSLMRHLFTYGPVLAGAAESAVLVETEIGLVPEGWDVVRLGGHCNFTTGKLNSNQAVINGKYPFFTCSQETYRISKYSFNCEAVLLSGNNARGIYSVKYYNGKFDAYQRTYVITIKDNHYLDYHYLRDVIETKLEELRVGSIGTSTKFLTLKMLLNLEIPLPHLPTQQKIASILSTVDKKIEAEENKKKALDELFKSLLHNLMTGKVRVNHLEVIS